MKCQTYSIKKDWRAGYTEKSLSSIPAKVHDFFFIPIPIVEFTKYIFHHWRLDNEWMFHELAGFPHTISFPPFWLYLEKGLPALLLTSHIYETSWSDVRKLDRLDNLITIQPIIIFTFFIYSTLVQKRGYRYRIIKIKVAERSTIWGTDFVFL